MCPLCLPARRLRCPRGRLRRLPGHRPLAWVGRFLLGVAAVVLAAFGTVFAVWGSASFVGAVHATVGTAGPYFLAYALWGGWLVRRRAVREETWGPPHLLLAAIGIRTVPLGTPDG